MRNRGSTPFNLSFLDIMFCGFGAVVLLVMLLNGKTLQQREEKQEKLESDVERAESLLNFARAHLAELQKEVETMELEEGDLQVQANQLREAIDNVRKDTASVEMTASRQVSEIKKLEDEKAKFEAAKKQRKPIDAIRSDTRSHLVGFDGEGKRQYLTGLKLGGERTLILLDASASMLDETIVNIVRRKLMSDEIRRRSPKWQRAVRTIHWLVSNIPINRRFQVYYFNTRAQPVIVGTDGQWLDSSRSDLLDTTISKLREIAPKGGTSFHNAFDIIGQLSPKPDSVLLLTDGLPTQGSRKSTAASITGKDRLELFNEAVARLPIGVPINTLLFPIEGDPAGASAFWKLAIETHGSFITPSRDWP